MRYAQIGALRALVPQIGALRARRRATRAALRAKALAGASLQEEVIFSTRVAAPRQTTAFARNPPARL